MDVSVATNERLFSSSNAEAEHEKMVAESGLSPSEWNHAMEEVRFSPNKRQQFHVKLFWKFQLKNIQNHMSLTKTHIESLVQTFANHKQPPAIYVTVRMSKIEMTKKNSSIFNTFL